MSSFLPLNANEDVRALTCKPVIFESAVINSSLTPSLRYSSPFSALIFTNGNTAIDFSGITNAGAEVFGFPRCQKRKVAMAIRIKIAAKRFLLLIWDFFAADM